MKLLFYAINGKGLGHLSRSMAIADSITLNDPGVKILFVTGTSKMEIIGNIAYPVIRIPSRSKAFNFDIFNGALGKIEREVLIKTTEIFRPDAVFYDFLMDEQVFKFCAERDIRNMLILRKQKMGCVRDIAKKSALEFVDTLVFPHEYHEWPDASRMFSEKKSIYTGGIIRPISKKEVDQAVAQFFGRKIKYIVLTIGGGGAREAQEWFLKSLNALSIIIKKYPDIHILAVPGPLFTRSDSKLPTNERILIQKWVPQLKLLLKGAQLVLSNAGYNTINEIRASNCPAVIYPLKSTGWDDQRARAEEMVEEGRAVIVTADGNDVATKVEQFLEGGINIKGREMSHEDLEKNFFNIGRVLMKSLNR